MCRDKNKFNEYADSFDEFGKSALSFSIKGREKIHSTMGLIASVVMYLCLGFFTIYRLKKSLLHEDPTIMEIKLLEQSSVEDEGIIFDIKKEFYAISVISQEDGKIRQSPSWIEFEFKVWETIGGENTVV